MVFHLEFQMCLFPPEWPLVWGDCDWQGALLNWKGRNLLSLPFSSHSSRLEIWCNMMQQRIWYLNNFWIYLISLAHFGSSQGRSVGCFSAFIFPWRQEAKDPPRQSSVVDFWQSCVDPVRIDMWWYVMICIIVSYWCHVVPCFLILVCVNPDSACRPRCPKKCSRSWTNLVMPHFGAVCWCW